MKVSRIEVFKDKGGKFRWKAIAHNGEQIADGSEGYERRIDCVRMARDNSPGVPVFYNDAILEDEDD